MNIQNATFIAKNYINYLPAANEYREALNTLIQVAENPAIIKTELNDYSWSEISAISKARYADKIFKLGDTKIDYMKNGKTIEYRIIGFNHDRNNSITFEATVPYIREQFSTNFDECIYKDSDIHKYLDNDFLDLVSEELRYNVKKVEKTICHRDSVSTFVTKFFILSEQEVYGRIYYSWGKEGHWYDYYKLEDVNYSEDGNGKWLRSKYRVDDNYDRTFVCTVDPKGMPSGCLHKRINGVAPAFCI